MQETVKAFFKNFIQNCENSERLDSVQTAYFRNWAKILFEKDIPFLKNKNMTKEDYLKCIVSVMNFLVLSDGELIREKSFNTESNNMMMKTLGKYGYDMISFTEHLSEDKLWEESPKEFFSDNERCLSFFITKLNGLSKTN